MKRFQLHTVEDVAGTLMPGVTAEGVVFANGKVAMTLLTSYTSVTVHDNIETVKAVHCSQGKSRIVMLDDVS